jgi:hypothetical protein
MITVLLDDAGKDYNLAHEVFVRASEWAEEFCPSYAGSDEVDVSDFSGAHDTLAEYYFGDERDATLFRLRWL